MVVGHEDRPYVEGQRCSTPPLLEAQGAGPGTWLLHPRGRRSQGAGLEDAVASAPFGLRRWKSLAVHYREGREVGEVAGGTEAELLGRLPAYG